MSIVNVAWQPEDSLRENKSENDLKDLLKTMVAFANSVAPDDTAKIFIGERDDGSVEGVTNTENIHRTIAKNAEKIYPSVYYRTENYERDGKQCVRVDIKRNGLAPHVGGPAWVRQGAKSVPASGELYEQLIALRLSKVSELLKWVSRVVTVSWASKVPMSIGPNWNAFPCQLVEVTAFFSTFKHRDRGFKESEPNDWLALSWDGQANCPHIFVDPDMRTRPPNGW
jgi:hypothetical protein